MDGWLIPISLLADRAEWGALAQLPFSQSPHLISDVTPSVRCWSRFSHFHSINCWPAPQDGRLWDTPDHSFRRKFTNYAPFRGNGAQQRHQNVADSAINWIFNWIFVCCCPLLVKIGFERRWRAAVAAAVALLTAGVRVVSAGPFVRRVSFLWLVGLFLRRVVHSQIKCTDFKSSKKSLGFFQIFQIFFRIFFRFYFGCMRIL